MNDRLWFELVEWFWWIVVLMICWSWFKFEQWNRQLFYLCEIRETHSHVIEPGHRGWTLDLVTWSMMFSLFCFAFSTYLVLFPNLTYSFVFRDETVPRCLWIDGKRIIPAVRRYICSFHALCPFDCISFCYLAEYLAEIQGESKFPGHFMLCQNTKCPGTFDLPCTLS